MIRSTVSTVTSAIAARSTTTANTNNNATRNRLIVNTPPLPPTSPTPAPAPRNNLTQAGLQRVVRRSRDLEISQRVIAPVGRSRRSHMSAAPATPTSPISSTFTQPRTFIPTVATSAAPGGFVPSVGGFSGGAVDATSPAVDAVDGAGRFAGGVEDVRSGGDDVCLVTAVHVILGILGETMRQMSE